VAAAAQRAVIWRAYTTESSGIRSDPQAGAAAGNQPLPRSMREPWAVGVGSGGHPV